MKTGLYRWSFFLIIIILTSCEKNIKKDDDKKIKHGKVYFQEINDTIFKDNLEKTIRIDLNDDRTDDLIFEIINLNNYNTTSIHEDDTLAARVATSTTELLDKSTYGYPDALDSNTSIDATKTWMKHEHAVLGTLYMGGMFDGKGAKYLGLRLSKNNEYYYGWVKVDCSFNKDTLRIINCGIMDTPNQTIKTGEY